ncbi:MAG TPA: alpha/beta hydrolase, partial [Terriglobales bacterium]|nr:alpha/beta hydrolase [Terriglobales bacterium]
GPPILLIHGLMAYSFSWRFAIPALAPVRTVYAPDLLGTGYSDHPSDIDYSITAAADRLWNFLDQLDVTNVDIVGSSLGGGIAVRMAASQPERVKKLVLAAPVNPWSRHGRLIVRMLATQPGGKMFIAFVPLIQASGELWLKRLFGDPKRICPGTLEGYSSPLLETSAWNYGLAIMANFRQDLDDLQRDYAALANKPVMLIWGTCDRAVHFSSAKEIMKRIPNARLEAMRGVGHIPYDEAPEEFNRLLLDFLLH